MCEYLSGSDATVLMSVETLAEEIDRRIVVLVPELPRHLLLQAHEAEQDLTSVCIGTKEVDSVPKNGYQ